MKFLCLHGAIGNPDNFGVQLDPLMRELGSDGTAEFQFATGKVQVHPPPGFEEYFGPGPHYRFLEDGGLAEEGLLERVRDIPQRETPEDTMRALAARSETGALSSTCVDKALGPLYELLDANPDIQGIIGYSEGAVAAGSLLRDEQRRFESEGRAKHLKCAMFFAGWPPLDSQGRPIYADETDDLLDVQSLHVIGANDPYIAGSLSLYNVFDEDAAMLFDHGKGHTIPRDSRTLGELANSIKTMMRRAGLDTPSTSADSSRRSSLGE